MTQNNKPTFTGVSCGPWLACIFMKPTPRTDAAEAEQRKVFFVGGRVLAEFARKLERENADLCDLVNDLLPGAIAHMAVNNGGADEAKWHPEHRKIYAKAKAFLANTQAHPRDHE